MERYEGYVFTALCSINFLVSCLLFSTITREQREPYMDEIFHVPQAQKYCQGKFTEWDPMITTLPGLYLVSVGLIQPVVWLFGLTGPVVCSPAMLRFVNLLFNCGNLYLLYRLTCRLQPRDKSGAACFGRVLLALILSMFPVLYFFTFLYYTDAGSTFFVLFSYLMTLHGCHGVAAMLGAAAILFRQTNVVWVAFCAGTLVAARLDEAWRLEHAKRREAHAKRREDRLASSWEESGMPASPWELPPTPSGARRLAVFLVGFFSSPHNLFAVWREAWPFAAVGVGFLLFVALNGGVAVGDRSSHQACFHLPQLFYFLSFSLFFSAPAWACVKRARRFLLAVRARPALFLALAGAALLAVWRLTTAHAYLLADNRHYTFYVWRRVVGRHPLARYLLVPAYLFSGWTALDLLRGTRSLFWTLGFLLSAALATVPQRLLELRYFIVPYLMFRLHASPLPSPPRLLLELLLHAALNAAAVHVFLSWTFQWPESSATQRFMW
ncbi:dol-P-Glc:Glc(2)Man(9)GlcNAc(2)-PP-Dol alpha-1,2-glucosyltransferase isoform 1-T17 [Menidia menidia]